MEDKTFPTAIWAAGWDEILSNQAECMQGTASLDRQYGLRVEIPFGQLLDDGMSLAIGGEQLPKQLDWLYGFSQDGRWLVLADARSLGTSSSYPGAPRQTLTGSRLLIGRERFNPLASVSIVEITVLGLAKWLGRSPITVSTELGKSRCEGYSINVNLRDDSCNTLLFDNDDLEISTYHRVIRKSGEELGIEVGHRAVVQIKFKHPVDLEKAQAVALKIDDFLTFCFGFYAEIEKMTVGFDDGTGAELILPLVGGKTPSKTNDQRMPLPYHEVRSRISEMIGTWLSDADWPYGPSGLLTSLLFKSWRLPVDLEAVGAAQMFEALVEKSMRSEDKRCEQPLPLGKRVKQRQLIDSFLRKHDEMTSFILENPAAFASRHIKLRNKITHRDPKLQTSAEELFWHSETVLLLSYCIVARELGVDVATVEAGIDSSGFKSGVRNWAKTRYASRSDISVDD